MVIIIIVSVGITLTTVVLGMGVLGALLPFDPVFQIAGYLVLAVLLFLALWMIVGAIASLVTGNRDLAMPCWGIGLVALLWLIFAFVGYGGELAGLW